MCLRKNIRNGIKEFCKSDRKSTGNQYGCISRKVPVKRIIKKGYHRITLFYIVNTKIIQLR